MSAPWFRRLLETVCALTLLLPSVAHADLTPDQKKEVSAIKKDLAKVGSSLRSKEFDAAEEIIKDAEARLEAISAASGEKPETDRLLASVVKLIRTHRQNLTRLQGKGSAVPDAVSFTESVAPILAENCLGCHGDNPRAGLRLDTFAGMKRGGQGGVLLAVGNPARSLIMARLLARDPMQRMPRNGEPLSREELQTIAGWISQGARFDGDSEITPLGRLKLKSDKPVEIAMATGNETVSFKDDIAPFLVTTCVRCHGGDNPRSGFSLETFELLMQGGDSGQVVLAGDLDGSRLWDLAGKQDPIKMPPGDARITRQNWEDLQTWIKEGAKYDGGDPKIPLRSLVPSEDEQAMEMLAKLTPEEFAKRRRERTADLWKRAANDEEIFKEEDAEFYLTGNESQERLASIAGWANEYLPELKKAFDIEGSPVWKGKLAILVFKDHFGYEEFNRSVLDRTIPQDATGHSLVSPGFGDAYIVLEDVGDDEVPETSDTQLLVIEHLTGAILRRGAGELPEWLVRGMGLHLAARERPRHPYMQRLPALAAAALQRLERPDDLLREGTFSPSEVGPVGYTLVSFLLSAGSQPQLEQFIERLQKGQPLETALQGVYSINPAGLTRAYAAKMSTLR